MGQLFEYQGQTGDGNIDSPKIEIIVLDALRAYAMHEVPIVSLMGRGVLPDCPVLFEDQIRDGSNSGSTS